MQGDTNSVRFEHIIDNTGPSFPTSVGDNPIFVPERFLLQQNYPNPFNPSTTIEYELPQDSQVILKIYNVLGQEVRVLLDENQSAGLKTVRWDGRNDSGKTVGSGVYLYRIQAGDKIQSRKMLLLR